MIYPEHEMRSLINASTRLKRLCKSLSSFSFPLVAQSLAGLITQPENHVATTRFELLVHLAALSCSGNRPPSEKHLCNWLNDYVLNDPLTELEGPVEDVFVSNVVTWFGNVRIFEGRWEGNSYYVETCIAGLLRIVDRPWATKALVHIMTLLRVSEALADRAQVSRYTWLECQPRQLLQVSSSTISRSVSHVCFDSHELDQLNITLEDLEPFIFEWQTPNSLPDESLGHTSIERRPAIKSEGQIIVVLPTAIGVAIRRFAIESALVAGELKLFESACHQEQYREVFLSGRPAWSITYSHILKHDPKDDQREFIGRFDVGSYLHLVFVPDDFEEIVSNGLLSDHTLTKKKQESPLRKRASQLASNADYRRGLTILVHGGIGRSSVSRIDGFPPDWHCISLSVPDFILLGNEEEFTAIRAWKLSQQVHELNNRGVVFLNRKGYLNLVSFAYYNDFELVPINMDLSPIYLHNDFIVHLRQKVRLALDQHGTVAPGGESWITIQRDSAKGFIGKTQVQEVFVVAPHLVDTELQACVETTSRPWWLRCSEFPTNEWHRNIVVKTIETVVGWLARAAHVLEFRLGPFPPEPITFVLKFTNLEGLTQFRMPKLDMPSAPTIKLEDGQVVIYCGPSYLSSFLNKDNSGDRMLIEGMIRGTVLVTGVPEPSDATVTDILRDLAESDNARFFHMTPERTPQDLIYSATSLPEPCFLFPEDLAWSRLDLAREAGYGSDPRLLSKELASDILKEAVDVIVDRIKSRLLKLSRESVIECSLLNFVAVQKDRRDWLRSAAAQLALHDSAQVLETANQRNFQRDVAGLSNRIIAEIAVCTSPYNNGADCSQIDLDYLIGQVTTLLECAGQRDALRYGLVKEMPIVFTNGSFGFNSLVHEMIGPLLKEHGKRVFTEAANSQEDARSSGDEEQLDQDGFDSAFTSEFGINLERFQHFIMHFTQLAVERGLAQLRTTKSEVIRQLEQSGAENPTRTYESLALIPRTQWDESNPKNGNKKDWYPWRFYRRLSVMRRPIIQYTTEPDPDVLIMPSLLAGTHDYLSSAAIGRLPDNLFDSREMKHWIGHAINNYGHQFNGRVAKRLTALGWNAKQELKVTQLGGGMELGDIDVLAWSNKTNLVYVIECKSLRFDRTIDEIGERVQDYGIGGGKSANKRTDLQKHLDRIAFLNANIGNVAGFTGVPVERICLCSALVTENLAVMQFTGVARNVLDLVTDFDSLDEELLK